MCSWFLHLISLKISYDEKAQVDVRVLWFHPGWEKAEKAQDRAETPERAEPVTGRACADFPEEADETEKSEADAFEKELTERVETAQVSATPGTDRHEGKNAGAGKIAARFRHFLSALKLKVQGIHRNLKKAAKKLRAGKKTGGRRSFPSSGMRKTKKRFVWQNGRFLLLSGIFCRESQKERSGLVLMILI